MATKYTIQHDGRVEKEEVAVENNFQCNDFQCMSKVVRVFIYEQGDDMPFRIFCSNQCMKRWLVNGQTRKLMRVFTAMSDQYDLNAPEFLFMELYCNKQTGYA